MPALVLLMHIYVDEQMGASLLARAARSAANRLCPSFMQSVNAVERQVGRRDERRQGTRRFLKRSRFVSRLGRVLLVAGRKRLGQVPDTATFRASAISRVAQRLKQTAVGRRDLRAPSPECASQSNFPSVPHFRAETKSQDSFLCDKVIPAPGFDSSRSEKMVRSVPKAPCCKQRPGNSSTSALRSGTLAGALSWIKGNGIGRSSGALYRQLSAAAVPHPPLLPCEDSTASNKTACSPATSSRSLFVGERCLLMSITLARFVVIADKVPTMIEPRSLADPRFRGSPAKGKCSPRRSLTPRQDSFRSGPTGSARALGEKPISKTRPSPRLSTQRPMRTSRCALAQSLKRPTTAFCRLAVSFWRDSKYDSTDASEQENRYSSCVCTSLPLAPTSSNRRRPWRGHRAEGPIRGRISLLRRMITHHLVKGTLIFNGPGLSARAGAS